ncbi:MAG: protein tyrosine phosphatase family protein [Gemmatimonadota bacterium]|nr:protein tyrosine phosphatase family protein [Gemmatimonadota bacterium]
MNPHDTERDLEAIAEGIQNASVPLPRVMTAGQLQADHLPRIADAGFRTVLDLRGSDEARGFDEQEAVRASGMEYVHLPVKGRPDDDVFARFREIMRDDARQPIVVHCGSASRVGGMMIPYLMLDREQQRDEALRMAEGIGLQSPELREAALEYAERKRGGGG